MIVLNPSTTIQSGTLATMNATTGSDGKLFYCTTYHATFQWVNDRWWPFGVPDPRWGFWWFDDFDSANNPQSHAWNAVGSGAAGAYGNLGTYNGLMYITTTTAATRESYAMYTAGFAFGLGDYYTEALVQISTLATIAEDFCIAFGWNDNTGYDANSACTDGAYFTLNRAVNTTKWITNTSSNGTKTSTNTNTSVVAGTFYRLGILVSQTNGNVVFSVNGTTVATHTTNIPSGAARSTGLLFKFDKTAGTAESDFIFDYVAAYGFYGAGGSARAS